MVPLTTVPSLSMIFPPYSVSLVVYNGYPYSIALPQTPLSVYPTSLRPFCLSRSVSPFPSFSLYSSLSFSLSHISLISLSSLLVPFHFLSVSVCHSLHPYLYFSFISAFILYLYLFISPSFSFSSFSSIIPSFTVTILAVFVYTISLLRRSYKSSPFPPPPQYQLANSGRNTLEVRGEEGSVYVWHGVFTN